MRDTAFTLGAVIDELDGIDGAGALRAEPMSVMQAIFVYGDYFLPQWVGGLAIDLAPLVIVLLLTLRMQLLRSMRDRDAPTSITGEQMEMAVAQIGRIMDAARRLDGGDAALPAPKPNAGPRPPVLDGAAPLFGEAEARKDG